MTRRDGPRGSVFVDILCRGDSHRTRTLGSICVHLKQSDTSEDDCGSAQVLLLWNRNRFNEYIACLNCRSYPALGILPGNMTALSISFALWINRFLITQQNLKRSSLVAICSWKYLSTLWLAAKQKLPLTDIEGLLISPFEGLAHNEHELAAFSKLAVEAKALAKYNALNQFRNIPGHVMSMPVEWPY